MIWIFVIKWFNLMISNFYIIYKVMCFLTAFLVLYNNKECVSYQWNDKVKLCFHLHIFAYSHINYYTTFHFTFLYLLTFSISNIILFYHLFKYYYLYFVCPPWDAVPLGDYLYVKVLFWPLSHPPPWGLNLT